VDSGNDHSNPKPNFEAGVAGARGSAFSILCSTATGDFVSVPMASFVTVGATQVRPLPCNGSLDFIGRASEGRAPESYLAWDLTRDDEIVTLRYDTVAITKEQ
jgi:hypothetical protein